jgi:hypothetical protein
MKRMVITSRLSGYRMQATLYSKPSASANAVLDNKKTFHTYNKPAQSNSATKGPFSVAVPCTS